MMVARDLDYTIQARDLCWHACAVYAIFTKAKLAKLIVAEGNDLSIFYSESG